MIEVHKYFFKKMNYIHPKVVKNPNKPYYLEWDDEDLKGKVKFLKYYERIQKKDATKFYSEIEFDEYGSILKKLSFQNGSLISLYEISLDKINKVIHYKTGGFEYGEFKISEFSNTYDGLDYNKKNKGSEFNLNNNDFNEKYDNNGRIIEYIENFKNTKGFQIDIIPIEELEIIRRYSYDKSGLITNQSVSERYVTEHELILKLAQSINKEFNSDEINIEEPFIYKEKLLLDFSYNKNEDIEQERIYSNNNIDYKLFHHYKYDKFGNWIVKKTFSKKNIEKIIVRKISYY